MTRRVPATPRRNPSQIGAGFSGAGAIGATSKMTEIGKEKIMLKNTYQLTRHNGQYCIEIRAGGRGGEFVGQTAAVREKSGAVKFRTITAVVEDFGEGDVVMMAVD